MARRLCFFLDPSMKVIGRYVEFEYVQGLAFSQKVKCALSLQDAIKKSYPGCHPLEVSSKSSAELGRALSAFSLSLDGVSLESAFQSSKVFEESGQFEFLLDASPIEAKRYARENGKGPLTCFRYRGKTYPLLPRSAFYDWLYVHALHQSKWKDVVLGYDVFSDIEFNDKKSINCQARAASIYVMMRKMGQEERYLASFESFVLLYERIEEAQASLPKR